MVVAVTEKVNETLVVRVDDLYAVVVGLAQERRIELEDAWLHGVDDATNQIALYLLCAVNN